MIKIYKYGEIAESEILRRESGSFERAETAAKEIIENVIARGDTAVREYSRRFDGCVNPELRVSEAEIERAYKACDKYFIETLEEAAANIRAFHVRQKREGFEWKKPDGTVLGYRILPVRRAGLYVPGGTAAYPSTVLMDAIPAMVAGVEETVMTTPPDRDGNISAAILVAARVAGISEIYRVGGAQAIAAMAYGTESIGRVDKIVGPGNAYVAAAKKLVSGVVGIDMIAGPSEILIIADSSANSEFLAADMLAQAEHDRLATAVLVCTDERLAVATAEAIERQLAKLPRKEIAGASIENNGKIIVVDSLDEAARISDALAPEHLEIVTENPEEVLKKVRNAGSIFLGGYTPEALGDYFAGTNHTLPTSGTARFSSALGVDDFMRRSTYIRYTPDTLAKCGKRVADFAEREGLSGHGRSITIRINGEESQ